MSVAVPETGPSRSSSAGAPRATSAAGICIDQSPVTSDPVCMSVAIASPVTKPPSALPDHVPVSVTGGGGGSTGVGSVGPVVAARGGHQRDGESEEKAGAVAPRHESIRFPSNDRAGAPRGAGHTAAAEQRATRVLASPCACPAFPRRKHSPGTLRRYATSPSRSSSVNEVTWTSRTQSGPPK